MLRCVASFYAPVQAKRSIEGNGFLSIHPHVGNQIWARSRLMAMPGSTTLEQFAGLPLHVPFA
jgi:hypothetical protein